jgi:hypothetical protein
VTKSSPHDSQNRFDSGLGSPHDGQLMVASPAPAAAPGPVSGAVFGPAGSMTDGDTEPDEPDEPDGAAEGAAPVALEADGEAVEPMGAPHVSHQSGSLETWPCGHVVMVVPHLECG